MQIQVTVIHGKMLFVIIEKICESLVNLKVMWFFFLLTCFPDLSFI
jgi:hypothetical protein